MSNVVGVNDFLMRSMEREDAAFNAAIVELKSKISTGLAMSDNYFKATQVIYALAEVLKDYLIEASDGADELSVHAALADDVYCEVLSEIDGIVEASVH